LHQNHSAAAPARIGDFIDVSRLLRQQPEKEETPMRPKWSRSAVLVLTAVSFAETSSLGEDHRPTVTVYVYNNAKVPESTLGETGGYVREMFDKAGIELVWRNSMAQIRRGETEPPGAVRKDGGIYVSVGIVPRPDRIAPRIRNLDGIMGWTPEGQRIRTYVFYERVEAFVLKNFSRIYTLRVPRLLTYAIAHELGHLLIPLADAHSEKGIMKPQLDGNDLAALFLDDLTFTAEEAQLMRQEIERRTQAEKMAR
jgi:hypothetical protein